MGRTDLWIGPPRADSDGDAFDVVREKEVGMNRGGDRGPEQGGDRKSVRDGFDPIDASELVDIPGQYAGVVTFGSGAGD